MGAMETDSCEYEILENACRRVCHLSGMSCEIGVRAGGSSHKIMQVFQNAASPRPHIAIDPYGNIEYRHWEDKVERLDYTNDMKNRAMADLHTWAYNNNYPFLFFPLEDTEFFDRFGDGVPIYDHEKTIRNDYALVFYDGPHTIKDIRTEIDFFAPRTHVGGMWVFDDIAQYPHMEQLDPYIKSLGFQVIEHGTNKISYEKTT